MVYQTNRNIFVNYVPELVFGTPQAPTTSGKIFRPNSGSMALSKEPINSNENRRDLQRTRGRHGSRSVAGSYVGDLSFGSYDDFIQAVLRGTFAAGLSLPGLSVAADQPTRTFTRSAGSWITDGVKVGDVVRFTGFATTGVNNNGRNFRVTAVTALVLTVAETTVATVTSAAGISLTRSKKCLMGVTPRSFTLEEGEVDIDISEVFVGCRLGQMRLSLAPNGMAVITFDIMGQDMQLQQGANSPYFTNVVGTASIGMTAVEAVIRLGSNDVVDLTGVDLGVNLNAAGQPVVGSVLTPDIFTNLAVVEGTVTALRQDVSRVQSFLNEDTLSLHLLFTENTAEPKNFCSFFVGNLSLASATKSELGSDGPRTQALTLLIGADDRGGAYDPGALKYQTNAP